MGIAIIFMGILYLVFGEGWKMFKTDSPPLKKPSLGSHYSANKGVLFKFKSNMISNIGIRQKSSLCKK